MDISGRREQSPAIAMTPSYSIGRTLESSIPIMWLTSGAGAEQKQYTLHFVFSVSFSEVGSISTSLAAHRFLMAVPVPLGRSRKCPWRLRYHTMAGSEFSRDQNFPPRNDQSQWPRFLHDLAARFGRSRPDRSYRRTPVLHLDRGKSDLCRR